MSEIKVQIQYTAKDLQKAYEAHFFSYYPIRTRLLLYFGVLSIAYSVFLLIISFIKEESVSGTLVVSFLIYGIGMLLYYRWKINRMGKTIFKQLDEFQAPMVFTISEDHVHTANSSGTSANRTWNSFVKALIIKDMVLLYPNQINFLMFPSVYFNETEFEKLKSLVRSKITSVQEK